METIIFPETCLMPAEQRWGIIFQFLERNKKVVVDFRKVNGEMRSMLCTTDTELMPAAAVAEHFNPKVIDYNTMPVWCIDKAGWRAFKTMNVTAINANEE